MTSVTLTEFRSHASGMLSRVEQAMSPLNQTERKTFISLLNKVLDAFEGAG